jgi:GTP cyclohydrolase II
MACVPAEPSPAPSRSRPPASLVTTEKEGAGKGMTAATVRAVRRVVSTTLPTRWGVFRAVGFERLSKDRGRPVESALAVILGDVSQGTPLLRVHSQCVTGEMLGSLRCDCREQLEIAMASIARAGRGLVIYEYQEGLDTVEADHALGFDAECRDFSLPAAMLQDLGVRRVRVLSNDPRTPQALADAGVRVTARIPCDVSPTVHSLAHLQAKKARMGHALTLVRVDHTEAVSDATGDPYHVDDVVGGPVTPCRAQPCRSDLRDRKGRWHGGPRA